MDHNTQRPDRRIRRRWNVMWPAILEVAGRGYSCTILDLSESGAKLDCYGLRFESGLVTLKSERFGGLEAKLQWVRHGQAGIRFQLAPAEIVEILKPVVPGMGRRGVARSTRPQRASFGRLRPVLA
jgi:hypothetical protein